MTPVLPNVTVQLNNSISNPADVWYDYMTSARYGAGILDVNILPLVSIDFNHNAHSAVADLTQTQVQDERFVRIMGWYDNEWGYANRLVDVVKMVSKSI